MTRTLISQAQIRRGRGRYVYWAALVTVLIVFTLVFIGPLYWMVTGALKSGQEIAQTPPSLFPKHPETKNYADAWNNLNLAKLMFNTFYYAIGAVFFQLVFDTAAAYALSKLRPILGNVVLALMLATLMIPAMVVIVPQYVTAIDLPFVHAGLLDSPWAIWLPLVANAFNIFLLNRFFDSIPEDLIAAAMVGRRRCARCGRSSCRCPGRSSGWSRSSRSPTSGKTSSGRSWSCPRPRPGR